LLKEKHKEKEQNKMEIVDILDCELEKQQTTAVDSPNSPEAEPQDTLINHSHAEPQLGDHSSHLPRGIIHDKDYEELAPILSNSPVLRSNKQS
jgi:hypothetical protein